MVYLAKSYPWVECAGLVVMVSKDKFGAGGFGFVEFEGMETGAGGDGTVEETGKME